MSDSSDIFLKPRLVVSRCLGFAACRYNGVTIPDHFVERLAPWVDYLHPLRRGGDRAGRAAPADARGDGRRRGSTATAGHRRGCHRGHERLCRRLSRRLAPRGWLYPQEPFSLLWHQGCARLCRPGQGRFQPHGRRHLRRAVLERYPGLAIEDEGRLRNARIREHFLTKLFALARFRQVADSGSFRELVRYQAEHKLLLMTYHQVQMRQPGQAGGQPRAAAVRRGGPRLRARTAARPGAGAALHGDHQHPHARPGLL